MNSGILNSNLVTTTITVKQITIGGSASEKR